MVSFYGLHRLYYAYAVNVAHYSMQITNLSQRKELTMKKTKNRKKNLLIGLLSIIMLTSLAGCGSKQEPNSSDVTDNTVTSSDTTTENQTKYISDLLHPSERTIWYHVNKMDKDAEVSVIIMEHDSITLFDLNGSDLTLGDVANMSDEEIYNMAESAITRYIDNYVSPSPDYKMDFYYYLKYDTTDLNYFITTNASGNEAISETFIFPPYALLRSDNHPTTEFKIEFTVSLGTGPLAPEPGEVIVSHRGQIYDTNFIGWSTNGELYIRRATEDEIDAELSYFTDDLNPNKDNLNIIYDEDYDDYFGKVIETPFDGRGIMAVETPDGEQYYFDTYYNDSYYVIPDGTQKHPYTPQPDDDNPFDDEIPPENDLNNDGIDDNFQSGGDGC